MRSALAVVFLVLGATIVHANDAPQACAGIEDKDQRLNCFDKLFPKAAAAPEETAASEGNSKPDVGTWAISTDSSPLDDSKTVQATLLPKSAVGTGLRTPSPMLIVNCKEKVTSFVIYADMFMTKDEPEVTLRIGKEKAIIRQWRRSTNYKAVGLWRGQEAIPFLKTLESKDNESLFVRVRADDRMDAEFNLSNISAAIASIRDACKW